MKGLLLKDLMNLKQQAKSISLVVIIWTIIAITGNNASMIGGLVGILSALLPITALAYDEKAKWDKYALTMPVTREDMVLSKYVLSLSLSAFAGCLSLVLHLIITNNVMESLLTSGGYMGAGILLFSIVLPLMFKYGVEKGRLLMLVIFLLPVIGGMALQHLQLPMPDPAMLESLGYLLPIGIILILLLSVWVSMRIYRKKEF